MRLGLGLTGIKRIFSYNEKNIKIPEKIKKAKGIDENIIDKIQCGIDNIQKEYYIDLSDIVVEKMPDEKADIPYMCRYTNVDGKHKTQFVINSGYDFNGFETIAEAFVRKRNGESIAKEAERLVEEYIERWRVK